MIKHVYDQNAPNKARFNSFGGGIVPRPTVARKRTIDEPGKSEISEDLSFSMFEVYMKKSKFLKDYGWVKHIMELELMHNQTSEDDPTRFKMNLW